MNIIDLSSSEGHFGDAESLGRARWEDKIDSKRSFRGLWEASWGRLGLLEGSGSLVGAP